MHHGEIDKLVGGQNLGLHIDVIGRSVAWFLRRTSVLLNLYRSWSIVFLTLVPCFPLELAPCLMLNLGS
jgi:hypothetical protein